jgi:hypothetical protein
MPRRSTRRDPASSELGSSQGQTCREAPRDPRFSAGSAHDALPNGRRPQCGKRGGSSLQGPRCAQS